MRDKVVIVTGASRGIGKQIAIETARFGASVVLFARSKKALDTLTLSQAKSYHEEGHFLAGSMGPKVLACIRFIESGGKEAIITSLDKADSALQGESGTRIIQGT